MKERNMRITLHGYTPLQANRKRIKTERPASFGLAGLSFYDGAPGRTRTSNPLIKSQLLYRLSHGCMFFYFAGTAGSDGAEGMVFAGAAG